jgi:hypothetical protein
MEPRAQGMNLRPRHETDAAAICPAEQPPDAYPARTHRGSGAFADARTQLAGWEWGVGSGRATLLRERFIVLVPTVWRLFGHNSDSIFGCPRRSRLINCAGEWLLLSNCRRDQ